MVDDIGRHEFRIVAPEARPSESHHCLRHVEWNERALRRLGGFDVRNRCKAGVGWQSAERAVEQPAERGRVDISDNGDLQGILPQNTADILLEIGDFDLRHALERAIGLAAIGMIAKRDFHEFAAGKRRRIGGVAPQS